MSNIGSQLPVFQGTWADQPYLRGDLVLRSGVLYQAVTDTTAQPGALTATAGKGNPASWVDVTALVLDFAGSVDPTAGAGIPTAIGSSYRYEGTGLYVKTGSGAVAWGAAGGGGSVQQVSLLGPYTFHYNDVGIDDNGVEVATLPIGAVVLSTWLVVTVTWEFVGSGVIQAYTGIATSQGGTSVKYPSWGALAGVYGENFENDPASRPAHFILHTSAEKHALVVSVYPPESTFTAGEGEAWALVATPA